MTPGGSEEAFDWRGWALVGAVVACFLVLPAIVVALPAVQDQIRALGLTFRDAYLVLPLIPALVLGAIAVWSAVRLRDGEGN